KLSAAAKYCDGLIMQDLREFNPVDWPDTDPARLYVPEVFSPEIAAASPSERASRPRPSFAFTATPFLEQVRTRSSPPPKHIRAIATRTVSRRDAELDALAKT